jgi:hypothetical protein
LMERWSPEKLAVTKDYLEGLPNGKFVLDDWMLLVEYMVHRYLAPDDVRTEAEWLKSLVLRRAEIMSTGRPRPSLGARCL